MAGGSRQPLAPGVGSLVCARRLAGRMAWRSLVLLPFLLTAGEDFARQLSCVGGRHWRCFQSSTLVPNSLRAAGTPKTAACPVGTLKTQQQPGCSRARQSRHGAGQRGKHPARVLQLEVKCGVEVGGVG